MDAVQLTNRNATIIKIIITTFFADPLFFTIEKRIKENIYKCFVYFVSEDNMELIKILINEIIRKKLDREETIKLRNELCKKYRPRKMPSFIEILGKASISEREKILKILKTKPGRTISGVAPVAIMSKPIKCPHVDKGVGPCIFCPGGPGSFFGNTPQSYTGKEPATRRAIRNKYDSYLQVFNRLEHYVLMGQFPWKVEFIVMGGTFPSFKKKYQEDFVKYAFKALNDFSRMFFSGDRFDFEKFKKFFEFEVDRDDKERIKRIHKRLLKLKGKCGLEKEQRKNEKAKIRCVALCIETRADYCGEKEIKEMLKLGCTRVEIGLQSIYDDVLDKINRGHKVKESAEAIKNLKDAYLKVGLQVMPGLPGSSPKLDLEMFKILFRDERFKPDALKIYPCMVLKGTKLYEMWKKGNYNPLTTEKAIRLIKKIKKYIPEYCRVMRIQRDTPSFQIEAGVDKTNLRQYLGKVNCRCIRCREVRGRKINWNKVRLVKREYKASGAREIFLSFEDLKNDILIGFLRLRIKENEKEAGIRELHVYGEAIEFGERGEVQHRGIGKRLIKEAERIAMKEGIKKLYVISGIGVKNYYSGVGFKRDKGYMSKNL